MNTLFDNALTILGLAFFTLCIVGSVLQAINFVLKMKAEGDLYAKLATMTEEEHAEYIKNR